MGERHKGQQKQARDTADGSSGDDGGSAKISAQEEADLSSALIAKLLAEDSVGGGQYQGYYDDYGNAAAYGDALDEHASGSEADEDWDPSLKRRRKSKGGKARRPASADSADHASSGSDASDGGEDRKSKRARQRKPKKAVPQTVEPGQFRTGAYTEEEEQKFQQGLEMFGRSWSAISEFVVTRDAKSIRSHAQKYFIKLFRDNVPLPPKVRESGDGYTLSGRPLDPNSAAARPYLQRVMQLGPPPPPKPAAEASSEQPAPPNDPNGTAAAVDGNGEEPETKAQESAPDRAIKEAVDGSPAADATADAKPANGSAKAADAKEPEQALPKAAVRTEYAMSRPQRNNARQVAIRYSDPHQMVRCTPFAGQPLSNVAGCQPFRLVVHTNAQLEMDFHAHLMLSEVIGLLGGCWDPSARVLTVLRALPCTALESGDAHTNVEMDPESELVVRHQITDAGLRVVGWYHSHPTFRPDPSIIDIENQTAYQTLFRDSDSTEEPFVGAIVGPYDPELPGPVSAFNWFYVGRSAVDRGHPKRLVLETAADHALSEPEQEILLQLLDSASGLEHHASLEEAWRPSSTELRSLKMVVSIAHRMPWLLHSENGAGSETPAPPADDSSSSPCRVLPDPAPANAELATADCESDCTVTDNCAPEEAKGEPASKEIPREYVLAGRRATQDPFLSALYGRFAAGVFRAGDDGALANSQALARVFAVHFMHWS
ncbi:hypothetical protein GGF46_000910 [Coemansia sp. RSA 552]|nr:hypothetical protein GGF46_000910 [Coemansia sp. RSA 552]